MSFVIYKDATNVAKFTSIFNRGDAKLKKKSLNKYITYVLAMAVFVTLMMSNSVSANTVPTDSIGMSIDGRNISLDVSPFVDAQNRTMVPIHFFREELGARVDWMPTEQRVTIRYQGQEIVLWIGNRDAMVNGNIVTMDTQAILVDGRTMIPVRFIGNYLGIEVDWQPVNRMVVITTAGANVNQSQGVSQPQSDTVIVTGNTVNVRSGPGTEHSAVGQVSLGNKLRVMDFANDTEGRTWYQVTLNNGRTGWIAEWLVASHNPSQGEGIGLAGRLIVIDPGHGTIRDTGRPDPGVVGYTGLTEKEVVMDISNRVADILTEKGANVVLTRTGPTNMTLQERAPFANNLDADLFVSIHADGNANRDISGTTTFFYAPADNPRLEPQRAQRARLAQLIQESVVEHGGRRDRGVQQRPFVVIRDTDMPSVLIEVAFLSNLVEEQLLADPEFRARIARGIAEGIEKYFN